MRLLPASAAFLSIAAWTGAHAGGPLNICNNQPVKYPSGSVTLNYDGGGTLGGRSKGQADAIVNSALALWTNVSTATVTLGRGADLPVDVTSSNYATYHSNANPDTARDHLNPVIYDTDGSIIDSMLGSGASNSILGFAGSWYSLVPFCSYLEGYTVIGGRLSDSRTDAYMTVVIAHELGHLIGLDHTQLDSSQGLVSSNYPLMYPIAHRSTATLHNDDVAAVTLLYPESSYTSIYGEVNGYFRTGATPIRGANIWATNTSSGEVFSVVSDYLGQGNGYFRLLLPAGTYTLKAEAIDSAFTSGSSVGPYSENSSGLSFQSPLYVNGQPMTPVTLGNSSPITFRITPGCIATATFDINGTGSVNGCGVTARPPDVNGDGRSDIVWRNSATGGIYRMLMNGLAISNGALVYTEGNLAWSVVGDGDFDGDGVTDLLWRNGSTGQVSILRMNTGGQPAGAQIVYAEANQAWKIVHTPDIDGDGKADILWWNSSTGQVYALLMDGYAVKAMGSVYAEPNTDWRIAAVGDFSGSGKRNQLLWRNAATGQVYLMTVTYSGAFTQAGQMIYSEPNLAWKIVAAADFNGDGRTDILWRNDSTGQVYMMLMNGDAVSAQAMVYHEPNLTWKIVAAGDYNGDGRADILWRNDSSGNVYLVLMNGLTVSSQGMIWQEPNSAWSILGPASYALP